MSTRVKKAAAPVALANPWGGLSQLSMVKSTKAKPAEVAVSSTPKLKPAGRKPLKEAWELSYAALQEAQKVIDALIAAEQAGRDFAIVYDNAGIRNKKAWAWLFNERAFETRFPDQLAMAERIPFNDASKKAAMMATPGKLWSDYQRPYALVSVPNNEISNALNTELNAGVISVVRRQEIREGVLKAQKVRAVMVPVDWKPV